MIEGEDTKPLAEHAVHREEVEICARGPSVEEDDDGSTDRAGDLAQVDGAEIGEFEIAPRGERRGSGQSDSTWSTVTVRDPLGAS